MVNSQGNVKSDDLLACAKREFNEETGLLAKGPFDELTPLKQKSGKVVHAFAVEADFDLATFSSNEFEMEWPPRSGKQRSFPEIDRIAYFSLATARRKILPGQRPFIEELWLASRSRHDAPSANRPRPRQAPKFL